MPLSPLQSGPTSQAHEAKPPHRPPPAIPDHEILQWIGSGSYGDVWLARNSLGTLRAIKVVWRETFSSERPYEREFAGLKKFEPVSRLHTGFVDILQVGRNNENGYFYYVMELADAAGEGATYVPRTLRSSVSDQGRLPTADCIRHFLSLTDALENLHNAGLIHRDIKASNIIIVGGVAKLADIGLVAAKDAERSFVGTEGFIPPEGPGTPAADVYSLGKALYEAATGKDRMEFPSLPFDTATGRTDDALMELNAILTRACAPEKANRYQTAAEMHADLALLLSGRSVRRMRTLEARLRWARQVGAVAGVIAVIGLGGFLGAGYRARTERENNQRLQAALARATSAERAANERLYQSLAASAVAELHSGLVGRRFKSLETITNAAAMHPNAPELRDAAITALALPDFREIKRWPLLPGTTVQCFNRDCSTILYADTNGLFHSRRAQDGMELSAFGNPGERIDSLSLLNSDTVLVAAGPERGLELWDLADRRLLWHGPADIRAALAENSRWLAVVNSNSVSLIDLASNTVRQIALNDPGRVFAGHGGDFAFAPEEGSAITILDFVTGKPRARLPLPDGGTAHDVIFSPDGYTVAVNLWGGRMVLYDLRSPETPRATPDPQDSTVTYVSFHPDGDWCVTSSWDSTTRAFGVIEGKALSVLRFESPHFFFSEDGRHGWWLDAITRDLCLFETAGRQVCRVLGEVAPASHSDPGPWNAAFSPDGRLLVTATYDGLRIYEAALGRQLAQVTFTNCYAVCFAGSNALYAAGPSGLTRWPLQWHSAEDLTVQPMQWITNAFLWHLQASDDGATIAVTGMHDFLLLHDGNLDGAITHHSRIRGSFISRDGRFVAAAATSQGLDIWDTRSGQEIRQFPGSTQGGLAFSPDARQIAFNDTNAVVVWNIAKTNEVWRTRLPGAAVSAPIAWSPDGHVVAAIREGMICVLFDADTGAVLARLEHPDARPYCALVFSPDSRQIACVNGAHIIHLWNLRALRRDLAALKLDWNQVPFPPEPAPLPPPQVHVAPDPTQKL